MADNTTPRHQSSSLPSPRLPKLGTFRPPMPSSSIRARLHGPLNVLGGFQDELAAATLTTSQTTRTPPPSGFFSTKKHSTSNSSSHPLPPISASRLQQSIDQDPLVSAFSDDGYKNSKDQDSLVGASSDGGHKTSIDFKPNQSQLHSDFSSDCAAWDQFYNNIIFPMINKTGKKYRKFIVDRQTVSLICKAVYSDIATQELRTLAKENSYLIDDAQRRDIKQSIKKSFAQYCSGHTENGRVAEAGAGAGGNHISYDTNDLSLLGPGHMPGSFHVSTHVGVSKDLSRLGPGQLSYSDDPILGTPKPKRRTRKSPSKLTTKSHGQDQKSDDGIEFISARPLDKKGNSTVLARREQHNNLPHSSNKNESAAISELAFTENGLPMPRSASSRFGELGHDKPATLEPTGPGSQRSVYTFGSSNEQYDADKSILSIAKPNANEATAGHKPSEFVPHNLDEDSSSSEDAETLLAKFQSVPVKKSAVSDETAKKSPMKETFTRRDTTASETSTRANFLASTARKPHEKRSDGDSTYSSQHQIRSSKNRSLSPISKPSTTTSTRKNSVQTHRIPIPPKVPSPAPLSTRSETVRPRIASTSTIAARLREKLSAPSPEDLSLSQFDATLEYTASAIASPDSDHYRPYCESDQSTILPTDTHNMLKHVDFSDVECETLLKKIGKLLDLPYRIGGDEPSRTVLRNLTKTNTYDHNTSLINHIQMDENSILRHRSRKDIRAFLSDLANGLVSDRLKFTRVETKALDPMCKNSHSLSSMLLYREHGFRLATSQNSGLSSHVQTQMQLRISDNIRPWRSWKGASGDVVACAWAPNSLTYAVGAAAPSNNEDLQYNSPQNLLLGDLISNVLHELPDHRIDRPLPNTIPSGPNSQWDMYNSLDPMLYMTVSSLQFSSDGSRLVTASHDKTAKIWDVSSTETATCVRTLHYEDSVTALDISQHHDGLFATATKSIQHPIHVYSAESWDSDDQMSSSLEFSSLRAQKKPQWELYPECVRWGQTKDTSRFLLAGFQQWGQVHDDDCGREGELCLWDVQHQQALSVAPAKTNVFCATWHPLYDMFAVGAAPGRVPLSHQRTTKSVVRTWDIRSLKRYAAEYECPAIDMQDVTFNPLYPNVVTAGCTDASTYVWDFRMPDDFLHKLQHGRPLADWDHTRRQEEADPGVMMTVWGLEGSRLYTGSSDGIVKCWDVSRSPEDALIADVADLGAGVQSGAFSPDFSHLLIGDADGAVHVLTSAPVSQWPDCTGSDDEDYPVEPIKLINADNPSRPANAVDDEDPGTDGILAARELLQSGQLVLNKSYGVGKGPNYSGPYAKYARHEGVAEDGRLMPEFDDLQPFSTDGDKHPAHAGKIQAIIGERKRLIAQTRSVYPTSAGNIEDEADEQKLIRPTQPSYPRKRALSSDEGSQAPSKRIKTTTAPSTSRAVQIDIIDLTNDSESDASDRSSSPYTGHQRQSNPVVLMDSEVEEVAEANSRANNVEVKEELKDGDDGVEIGNEEEDEDVYSAVATPDSLEDNHWWPYLDMEVFKRLGV